MTVYQGLRIPDDMLSACGPRGCGLASRGEPFAVLWLVRGNAQRRAESREDSETDGEKVLTGDA